MRACNQEPRGRERLVPSARPPSLAIAVCFREGDPGPPVTPPAQASVFVACPASLGAEPAPKANAAERIGAGASIRPCRFARMITPRVPITDLPTARAHRLALRSSTTAVAPNSSAGAMTALSPWPRLHSATIAGTVAFRLSPQPERRALYAGSYGPARTSSATAAGTKRFEESCSSKSKLPAWPKMISGDASTTQTSGTPSLAQGFLRCVLEWAHLIAAKRCDELLTRDTRDLRSTPLRHFC